MSTLRVVTPAKDLKATSSLVRRLVHPNRDSAKKRICQWLSEIADQQLFLFGLTVEEIAILRAERASLSDPINSLTRANAALVSSAANPFAQRRACP